MAEYVDQRVALAQSQQKVKTLKEVISECEIVRHSPLLIQG